MRSTQQPTLSSSMPAARHAAVRAMLASQVVSDTAPAEGKVSPVRHRRPVVRRAAFGCAAGLVVATTATALLVSDPTAAPANAAWTAMPTTAPGAEVSAQDMETWASQCTELGVGGLAVQGVPARPEAARARDVLIDRRGAYTFCVDISPGSGIPSDPLMALAGLTADGGDDDGLSAVQVVTSDEPFEQPTGADILVVGGDLTSRPAHDDADPRISSLDAYQLWGLSGADVTGVDIVLTNGLRITASLDRGMWGAWWPIEKGSPTGSHLVVRTNTGERVEDPRNVAIEW